MNKTEKIYSFLEDIYLNFDEALGVFVTNIVTCVLNTIFSPVTCLGNFLIVFAIAKTQDLHSPSFILLGCLATSDLLVGLLGQPIFVVCKITELKKNFNMYCTLKTLLNTLAWITVGSSCLTLAAVFVDRLLCLTLHLKYNTTVTVSRIFKMTSVLWIFCITFFLVRFWESSAWNFIAIAVSVLTFLIIAISTLKIFQIARRHQRQITVQALALSHLQTNTLNAFKCKKSTVTVLYIFGLLLLFCLPYFIVWVVDIFFGYTTKVNISYSYAVTAIFINSLINPFVYCWRIKNIRQAVKNILRRERHWRQTLDMKKEAA